MLQIEVAKLLRLHLPMTLGEVIGKDKTLLVQKKIKIKENPSEVDDFDSPANLHNFKGHPIK